MTTTDSLGYRGKFAVLVPSTNTSVQPEFDDMRPAGVTNHTSRIVIPDDPVHDDNDFALLMARIRDALACRRKASGTAPTGLTRCNASWRHMPAFQSPWPPMRAGKLWRATAIRDGSRS
jgi:hypothetical protein